MLPVQFYETLFLLSLLTLPLLVYQAAVTVYLVALLLMYLSLLVIRGHKKTTIPIDGKSVFISGCDTGFGHAVALRLHGKGFRVFAGCLFPDREGADTLRQKCPENLFVVPLDVTNDESVRAAEQFVRENLADTQLWGLVNNAGVYGAGDFELTSIETFQRVFGVNVFGMVRLTKAFVPLIRNAKGRIVVVSSIAGPLRSPSCSSYGASKVALEAITDCLRMEMIKFGVNVSIIQPASFGSNTNITDGENLTRLFAEAEETWENSSEEVKKVYGKNYTRSFIEKQLNAQRLFKCTSVDPVLNAIEDGLLSSNPKYRNLVHGGPYFVDIFVILTRIYCLLPQFLGDWMMCKMVGHSDTSNLQGMGNLKYLGSKDAEQ